jgi:hypothetical protein
MNTFADFGFDGEKALSHLVATSEYGSLLQLVASLTLFSHPTTVAQTANQNLFRVIRRQAFSEIGHFFPHKDGLQVMHDDNLAAIETFNWSNLIRRCPNSQYNHIWSESRDVSLYTNLANICVTPAFIAKLTDTNILLVDALRYRSYELYGFWPTSVPVSEPADYDRIVWAETLPAVNELEIVIRTRLKRLKTNRTLRCARNIGWFFSGFQPDSTL